MNYLFAFSFIFLLLVGGPPAFSTWSEQNAQRLQEELLYMEEEEESTGASLSTSDKSGEEGWHEDTVDLQHSGRRKISPPARNMDIDLNQLERKVGPLLPPVFNSTGTFSDSFSESPTEDSQQPKKRKRLRNN